MDISMVFILSFSLFVPLVCVFWGIKVLFISFLVVLGIEFFIYILLLIKYKEDIEKCNQRKKEFISKFKETTLYNDMVYENFKWIVDYYISKNSYPYLTKDTCLELKRIFELKEQGVTDNEIDKIISKSNYYSFMSLDDLRQSLINRLKYRKLEIGDFDICNKLKVGYKKFNLHKDNSLKLDKWLVKQILKDDNNYGTLLSKDIFLLNKILESTQV